MKMMLMSVKGNIFYMIYLLLLMISIILVYLIYNENMCHVFSERGR